MESSQDKPHNPAKRVPESAQRTLGRRLTLWFLFKDKPELDRVEFRFDNSPTFGYWQQGDKDTDKSFAWSKLPKALSLFVLDHLLAASSGAVQNHWFSGAQRQSLAATLGDAICQPQGKLHDLFIEVLPTGKPVSRVQKVFDSRNPDGREAKERLFSLKSDFLPTDCIEIFWEGEKLEGPVKVRRLDERIRKSLGLPVAPSRPAETPAKEKASSAPVVKRTGAAPTTATELFNPSSETKKENPPAKPQAEAPKSAPSPSANRSAPPPVEPPKPVAERFPDIDQHRDAILPYLEQGADPFMIWRVLDVVFKFQTGQARFEEYYEALLRELFPMGPIKKSLLEVPETEESWSSQQEIFYVKDNVKKHVWTLEDVCRGTLILGSVGSGKTTGSGRYIAHQILANGFGGLILTTKQSDLDLWLALTYHAGRGGDVAVVQVGGSLRLNLLQYEMESCGAGAKMTGNLLGFFRSLASAVQGNDGPAMNEGFWEKTGDELISNTLECFVLGKIPITLDNLCSFIVNAPMKVEDAADGSWQKRQHFGPCLQKAESCAISPEDHRMLAIVKEYWLQTFPTLSPNTRSCIVTAFTAMIRVLRTRHINDLLSTITTITPDSIFRGRLVILNLPVNEYKEAGLMVQAAWKYLFHRAALRRQDKSRGDHCRPVFVWEDESQNHLIDSDADFLPVAREYRVANIKLSQNISNFYARFGGGDSSRAKVNAILGSLNTRLFHANGDMVSNHWAAEIIGTELKTHYSRSTTPAQAPGFNPLMDVMYRLFKRPSETFGENQVREHAIHPHEFARLPVGSPENNFLTGCVMTQVGRTFTGGLGHIVAYFPMEVPTIPSPPIP